jgi:ABC-type nitrate/sulfonate/bicarbonate transport system substrate-binding protein
MKKIAIITLLIFSLSFAGGAILEAAEPEKSKSIDNIVFASCVALEFFGNCSLYAADYLGYFKEEGLAIQYEEAIGTIDAKMVSTGHAQFGYPSPGVILTSLEAGVDIISVYSFQPVNIFGFASNRGAIKKWDDLKGKSIALGDASWKSIGAPLIKAAGLDPEKDVTWVTAGDARYQSTASGQTDVLLTWDVEYGYLLGLGFDFDYLDADSVLSQLSNSVIVSTKYAAEHPDIVKRFNRAHGKGMYFTLQNPAAVADIVLRKYPGIDVTFDGAVKAIEYQVESYFGSNERERKQTLEKIGFFSEERWKTTIEAALASGIISHPIPLEKIYTNDFVDDSWSRADVEADAKNYVFGSEAYNKTRK